MAIVMLIQKMAFAIQNGAVLCQKGFKFLIPMLIALAALLLAVFFNIGNSEKVLLTFSGFIDTQINIVAILISFSVAIITILVSADNRNIQCLKETESNKKQYKPVNGKQLSLFQILLSNIAYNVIVEIIYLAGLIAISLMQNLLPIITSVRGFDSTTAL